MFICVYLYLFLVLAGCKSSLGHSNFGHSNINLYNNYATYTQAPQYTTANPNRCPANANIRPTSSGAATGDHPESKTTNKPLSSIRYHVQRKSKLDNGNGSDTVVANKHGRQFNESVIEEGHNNNSVSKLQIIKCWLNCFVISRGFFQWFFFLLRFGYHMMITTQWHSLFSTWFF